MKKIIIDINDKEDLCEKYNKEVLASSISKYIESECISLRAKDKVAITICSAKKLSEEDQKYLVRIIKNNYLELLKEKKIIKEHQNISGFILSFLGIFFIAISNLLENSDIISELTLIIGWVILWEVVYRIVFDDIKDRIKIQRYKKLAKCQINFIDKKLHP